MATNEEGIYYFDKGQPSETSHTEQLQQPTSSVTKSKGGKIIATVLIMGLLAAIPVISFLSSKEKETVTRPTQTRSSSPVERPQASAVRRQVPVNLDQVLGEEGRKAVSEFPKTQAEIAQEQAFARAFAEREAALVQREKEAKELTSELTTQLQLVAVMKEDLSTAIRNISGLVGSLSTSTGKLEQISNDIKKAATGSSSVNGVFTAAESNPPLSDYSIRSIINRSALVAIRSRPGEYLRLKVGSAVPGHGTVSSIGSTNGSPSISLSTGETIGG